MKFLRSSHCVILLKAPVTMQQTRTIYATLEEMLPMIIFAKFCKNPFRSFEGNDVFIIIERQQNTNDRKKMIKDRERGGNINIICLLAWSKSMIHQQMKHVLSFIAG